MNIHNSRLPSSRAFKFEAAHKQMLHQYLHEPCARLEVSDMSLRKEVVMVRTVVKAHLFSKCGCWHGIIRMVSLPKIGVGKRCIQQSARVYVTRDSRTYCQEKTE
jgi:hypothetical protein